ncbi:MAG: Dicer-like protein 2 [Vezdaea aestivalis]|nr:MAG: Dicer-like protein 2 [Vezdaea aestivalis]
MESDSDTVSSADFGNKYSTTPKAFSKDGIHLSVEAVKEVVEKMDSAQGNAGPRNHLKSADMELASKPTLDPSRLTPRAYQMEMLQKSLDCNIIAAMETGSGKTLVAILRMQAELEKGDSSKQIWFLVTTLALAEQQCGSIRAQLPSVHVQLLTSDDKVDKWSKQRIWDAALKDIQIVVSTHKVLADALSHTFVKMENISLLVFDEAHNCTKSHPSNQIMRYHFHPRLQNGQKVPCIFGMTASPIFNSKINALQTIESNLNAICKTPAVHQLELEHYVNRPTLKRVTFRTKVDECENFELLIDFCDNLDIHQDPYIISLKKDESPCGRNKLRDILLNQQTYTNKVLRGIRRNVSHVNKELGLWASHYYLHNVTELFLARLSQADFKEFGKLDNEERWFLHRKLNQIRNQLKPMTPLNGNPAKFSNKLKLLFDILSKEHTPDISCIVFIKRRLTVSLLNKTIELHPSLQKMYRSDAFMGRSKDSHRAIDVVLDLMDSGSQENALKNFRSGAVNLICATDVLEEGIDISACNLVICFDKPANLKSFIQRRGRARKTESKFIIMMDEADHGLEESSWRALEQEMIKQYKDDMRVMEEMQRDDGMALEDGQFLTHPQTGAKLSFDDAISHLYHFCDKIPKSSYYGVQPEFDIEKVDQARPDSWYTASVTLPNSVDPSLRHATSSRSWPSQKTAQKDAAFQAYSGLYRAGLVNEHLLPLSDEDDTLLDLIEKRPAVIDCRSLFNPWRKVASQWKNKAPCYLYSFTVQPQVTGATSALLWACLPLRIDHVEPFSVFWDSQESFEIRYTFHETSDIDLSDMRRGSLELLGMTLGVSRIGRKDLDFLVPITYLDVWSDLLGHPSTLNYSFGKVEQSELLREQGTIFDPTASYAAYRPISWALTTRAPTLDNCQEQETGYSIEASRVPKRTDFLHRPDSNSKSPERRSFAASECIISRLPFPAFQAAKFIPSIIHRIRTSLITQSLLDTVLKSMHFEKVFLIQIAITSPMACEGYDYQSLEFLGDSLLKFFTAINLYAEHPTWHEGYLSLRKDRIVSNGNLARICTETGIDEYIITRGFTGNKWRPPYISDLLDEGAGLETRELSTKVMADVIEALLGASFVDGGLSSALSYLKVILPDEPWEDPIHQMSKVTEHASMEVPVHFQSLVASLPYKFRHVAHLIEALTHNSHISLTTRSYQRFEFIGDALLDYMVVSRIFAHSLTIPPGTLHLLRAAVCSHNFLSFCCLEPFALSQVNSKDGSVTSKPKQLLHPIWHYMRHSSHHVIAAQEVAAGRFARLRSLIREALEHGSVYPWTLLAQLGVHKFFSDIIESLIGAIYVDSGGNVSACEAFASKVGIFHVLDKLMQGNVELVPPKNRLGMWASDRKITVSYKIKHLKDAKSENTMQCKVLLDEEEIVELSGCIELALEFECAETALKVMQERERVLGVKIEGKASLSPEKRKGDLSGEVA